MGKTKSVVSAVYFTDLHLSEGREQKCIDIVNQIIALAKKHKADTLIFGGDWFTSRRGQSLSVISATHQIFMAIESAGLKLIGIPGNHDKVSLDDNGNYLSQVAFKYSSINIADDLYFAVINGLGFHFIPYFTESKGFPERLSKVKIRPKTENILITHIAFKGVRNNDGSKVDNSLTKDKVKEFDLVLVGHYHNRQKIEPNIHYTGSTDPRNFGEDNDKGAVLIYSDAFLKYVQLDFEKYKTVKLHPNQINTKKLASIQEDKAKIRVVVEGEKQKVQSIDTAIFEEYGFAYQTKFKEQEVDVEEIDFEPITESQIVEEYGVFAEERNIGKDQLELGLKYLN